MSSPLKQPWYERFRVLGWFRRALRNGLFRLVRRVAASEEGRDILIQALEGIYAERGVRPPGIESDPPSPYLDLGIDPRRGLVADGEGAIIITGRFRSGSTLLWNLFRNLNGFTAYYEPHNERRWFDPQARGDRVDPTHRKVEAYWTEYEGLTELAKHYHEEWTYRRLFMDETAWDADLLAYTRILLARAKGRPVLQCNRVDFRLGWHRRHFPKARIVHLYRHPRDQWCSALMDIASFPASGSLVDFDTQDRFYLLSWCRDLKQHFPFLDERTVTHPYQLFYFLWKLSFLYGRHYADHSLSMEALIDHPEDELHELFAVCNIDPATQDMARLKGLIVTPERGKWRKYAPEDWFRRYEQSCEEVLADFFRAESGKAAAVYSSLQSVS
jgi:hypothetical protein